MRKALLFILIPVTLVFSIYSGFAAAEHVRDVFMSDSWKSDMALERLENKFGMDFEITSVGRNLGDYFNVTARPAGVQNCGFEATVDLDDEYFADRFVQRLVCNQVAAEYLAETGADYAYAFDTSMFLDYADVGMTVPEYISMDEYASFSIELYYAGREYDVDRIRAAVGKIGVPVSRVECVNVNAEQLEWIRGYYDRADNPNGGEIFDYTFDENIWYDKVWE